MEAPGHVPSVPSPKSGTDLTLDGKLCLRDDKNAAFV